MKHGRALIKALVGFILLLVAYVGVELLKVLLFVANVLLILVFNLDPLIVRIEKFAQYCYILAFSYDQTGNVWGSYFFDLILRKNGGHAFGHPKQPISYAIAKNWTGETLTRHGVFWAKFLIWIDYGARKRGSNHLIESIENTEKL